MKAAEERVRVAASARVASTMKTQRAAVSAAIKKGRPLDAEEDPEQKLRFIQRKVQVDRGLAARIANYEDPNRLPLTPTQKAEAESLQGNTTDFVPIRFLDIARAASRSVARVAFPNRSPQGTGFMISPRLFLTNHHVISSVEEARAYVLEFDFEEDANLNKLAGTRFRLDPEAFFLFDATDDLDFAVVAVGNRLDGDRSLEDFGYLPLLDTKDKHMKAIYVNVIQHPEGRPKELVVRENRITGRTANTLVYGADTLRGSSGSPVFNDDFEAIALHHWGSPERALLDNEPNVPTEGNEGIRISSIVTHLKTELENLNGDKASLLREAITPRFRHPSLYPQLLSERNTDTMSQPQNERADGTTTAPFKAGDTTSFTIPLVVSVSLGAPSNAGAVAPAKKTQTDTTGEAEGFKFVPDPKYSNRRGYNPNFLGVKVPLPKLTPEQKSVAARNLKAKAGDDPFEVKYQHFSVVMNGERRLAFHTAVNIDGAAVVRIDRDTGEIKEVEVPDDAEGAEAYETWYDDQRIDADKRSDQSLYSSSALSDFQRGHLVKRTDPSWGTANRAFKGQADTFHFTNCAPQHRGFNPNRKRWAGVEDWISKGSNDEDLRVTVFCGPVLRDDDPKFDYILVPREFWKVIVRVEDGELLATAILADQSDLLGGGESASGAEDLPPFPTHLPKDYQVTIAEIEELTGLDFGTLREHDTFTDGSESISGRHPRQLIDKLDEIQIHPRRRR